MSYHVAMDLLLTAGWMEVEKAAPMVGAALKEVVRAAEAESFQTLMNRIARRQFATADVLYGSEDQIEGAKPLAEKRNPVWKNR